VDVGEGSLSEEGPAHGRLSWAIAEVTPSRPTDRQARGTFRRKDRQGIWVRWDIWITEENKLTNGWDGLRSENILQVNGGFA
jgi:hypothetical protein